MRFFYQWYIWKIISFYPTEFTISYPCHVKAAYSIVPQLMTDECVSFMHFEGHESIVWIIRLLLRNMCNLDS